ncbi:hypothetical protein CPAR01_15659, partial [Colletotrichum paranaense]
LPVSRPPQHQTTALLPIQFSRRLGTSPTVIPSPSLPHHTLPHARTYTHTDTHTHTHTHTHIRRRHAHAHRHSVYAHTLQCLSSPSLAFDAAVSRVPSHCSKRPAYARDGCILPPPTLHVHIAVQPGYAHNLSLSLQGLGERQATPSTPPCYGHRDRRRRPPSLGCCRNSTLTP